MSSSNTQPEGDGMPRDLLSQPRIRHITEIRIHKLDIHAHLSCEQNVTVNSELEEPSSPMYETRPSRRTSQGSVHPYSLKDVREIAEDRISGEVPVIEEEPDGNSRSSPNQGAYSVERSISSSSLGRISRSPRLAPRRASSNDTITEHSTSAGQAGSRGFGARPGLSAHGRSRSRLIVPRPPTETNGESFTENGAVGIDIIQDGSKDMGPQSRARSGSISSLRSAHHQYHHHHHPPGQHSTSLGAGGRRERASTIVSQYAINTTGHVTLTDELGYEKKDHEGSGKEPAFQLDEAVLREEKELVRCFVTMIMVEDLRAALKHEQEYEACSVKVPCAGRPGRPDGEPSKNGPSRRSSGSGRKVTVLNGNTAASRPRNGQSTISSPGSRSRGESRSTSRDSPANSSNPARPALSSGTTVPSPSRPSVNPGGRIRPPASRQNTLRAGSFSHSNALPDRDSSPIRAARLSSPPSSRTSTPPTSPSMRSGSFLGTQPNSRRSSETTLNGMEPNPKSELQVVDAAPRQVDERDKGDKQKPRPLCPFYISPIHRKSLYPTFSGVSVNSDFADWAYGSTGGGAEHQVLLEAWCESSRQDEGKGCGWTKLKGLGGIVDLASLREVAEDRLDQLPDNTLIFRFSQTSSKAFYLPYTAPDQQSGTSRPHPARRDIQSIVERSMRETKMQKSVDLEGLERLVAVSRILKEGEAEVKTVEDRVTASMDEDRKLDGLNKYQAQKENDNTNLQIRIDGLRQANEAVAKACTERRKVLAARREQLHKADDVTADLDQQIDTLDGQVGNEIDDRKALSPATHRHRARLVNTLDAIFPIVPLDPSTLLYSILSVPLPIPTDPKSPAPPANIASNLLPSGIKVDEETTATALGMVAMCVQRLGEITGEDLLYPVTCLGSRSLVRDNISVITGPRSFPLYSKGIERYRYEYAIFLLNKDIEMMMIQAGIMIQDPRHTLPNLKTLLLTLASRDKPPLETDEIRTRGSGSRSMTPSPFTFLPARTTSTTLEAPSALPGYLVGSPAPSSAGAGAGRLSRRGSVEPGTFGKEPSEGYTRSVSIASLTALTGGKP